MAIDLVSDLAATSSDVETIGLTWTSPQFYIAISVYRSDNGGGSYDFLTSVDVEDTSYSDTPVSANIKYYYKLLVEDADDSGYSNTDSAGCWRSIPVATVNVLPNIGEYVTGTAYSDTLTAAIDVTGIVLDAISLKTNYAYYVGSSNGKVYQYSDAYKSDAGTSISARWESKDTDFADQSIENSDKFKTVEFVRLHYIDKTEDATVSVLISTDGGATWTPITKSIGSGDGKGKTKDFHFITTGQIFRFAVENASTADEFQFAGLEVFYSIGGDYFQP